eukprot:14464487-Ditylum_brightwellii.AAC.1
MKRARFMVPNFCGYNSNPSCHPDYRTPTQKKVMGAAYARRKNSGWVGLKAGIFCIISSGTVAQNTTLFPANVVGGADKAANARPLFQVNHVED